MTEFLENKLSTIFDGIDNDIITISDAIFLREFIKAQATVVEELKETPSIMEKLNKIEGKISELSNRIKTHQKEQGE